MSTTTSTTGSQIIRNSNPSESEVIWAAGLFVGEGHVSVEKRKQNYLVCALSMCDERSVVRFAHALAPFVPERFNWKELGQGISVSRAIWEAHDWQPFYRVHLGGRTAEGVLRAMWPWLKETDKGDQTLAAFRKAKLLHPSKPMPEFKQRANPAHAGLRDRLDQMESLWYADHSVSEIAAKFGVTEGAVRYWMRKHPERFG